MLEKKERKKGGEVGGSVHSTTVPFKTVAMETPLSSPLMCVYVAGFDRQIKAHWGKEGLLKCIVFCTSSLHFYSC